MIPLGNITSAAQVLSAYQASGPQASTGSGLGNTAGTATDFSSLVGNAAESALQTMRQAEQTTAAGVAGKADVQQVVEALGDAEVTMQTVVAVRDKVLGAYNDIMRMTV
jgi:flagellar hook-basal body complex protein FliE